MTAKHFYDHSLHSVRATGAGRAFGYRCKVMCAYLNLSPGMRDILIAVNDTTPVSMQMLAYAHDKAPLDKPDPLVEYQPLTATLFVNNRSFKGGYDAPEYQKRQKRSIGRPHTGALLEMAVAMMVLAKNDGYRDPHPLACDDGAYRSQGLTLALSSGDTFQKNYRLKQAEAASDTLCELYNAFLQNGLDVLSNDMLHDALSTPRDVRNNTQQDILTAYINETSSALAEDRRGGYLRALTYCADKQPRGAHTYLAETKKVEGSFSHYRLIKPRSIRVMHLERQEKTVTPLAELIA